MSGPGFSQRQQVSARQEMHLLPQMLQALEVLQLPTTELEAFLQQCVEENEALSLEAPPGPAPPPGPPRGSSEDSQRHDAWLESQPAPVHGLTGHLEEQLGMLDLEPEVTAWVKLVISCLDPSGYLTLPDAELMALGRALGLEGEAGVLGRAIAIVQALEPRGVGGRDAVEALLLQLDPDETDYALCCRLLEEFLEDVAKNRMPRIARELGIDLERLDELLDRIRELDIAPGRELSVDSPPSIRPDVVCERTSSGFEVRLESSGLPSVTIDPTVQRIAKDRRQTTEVRRYLRERLDHARWLVEALEQRKRTLLNVATSVFEAQGGFLEGGRERLVPLSMGDVAEEIGVHVSTVSRAVAGKYAETPWGVVPLRSFFAAPAAGSAGGVRGHVQTALQEVLRDEDPARPLSDDAIVEALARRGFRLARRTVAKHREELGIPSSYRRRKFSA